MMRSGMVALAGRPNVGKSTLVNAIVGEKVAIVSEKPQTTRRAIRGIRTTDRYQIVLADLPGVQRPRDAMTERMARRVSQELEGSDAVLLTLNAREGVGPGDRYIARSLAAAKTPVTIAVNKIDRLGRPAILAALGEAQELDVAESIFPVSARTGKGVPELVEHLATLMPIGPALFDVHERSDQSVELRIAELIREAAIKRTFQEVPHAVEAIVEEIEYPREGFMRVRALIWVETASQKGILIGAGGRLIRAIGSAARREIERVQGRSVHLDLSVRVRRDWRADEGLLDRLGIG